MKFRLVILLSLISPTFAASQGWSHVGPDSAGWQYVRGINVRWFGTDSMYLAACTDAGIAFKLADRAWSYSLPNIGDGIHIPFTLYESIQFSPWEPDSAFLAYEIFAPDPVPQILKVGSPCAAPPFWPGDLGGACFQLSPETFFTTESDSVLYGLMCGLNRSVKPWRAWTRILDCGYQIPSFLAIDRTAPSVLWTGMDGGNVVLRSGNGGATWDTITSFPFLPRGPAIEVSGDTILLAQWSPGDTAAFAGITASTDRGQTWSPRYTSSGIRVVRWASGRVVYAGGPAGILVSGDAGLTWHTFNDGLPGTFLTDIAVYPGSDTLLVSVLNYGVLKVWNYVVGVDQEARRPASFALEQNYPNPFNPTTSIAYTVGAVRSQSSGVSDVRIVVYDILGREVAVLVNQRKLPGSYQVEFDGSKLATGIYLYRIQAGQFVETKKLILLR